MSVKNSPTVSQWVTNFQTTIYPQTGVVDSTTNYLEDLNDSLVIEDLDFGDLEVNSSSVRTSLSTGKYDGDFDEQIPGVISEASTQNNLYILVRLPTNPKKLASTTTAFSQTTLNMSDLSEEELHLNVDRRIFPILEEEVADSIQETPQDTKASHHKVTCWTKDSEVKEEFSTTTKIICETIPYLLPNQVPDPTDNEELFVPVNRQTAPIRCQNQIDIQELNFNSDHFKDSPNVSLENYGILITPTKMPKTENLLVFQVDTEDYEEKKQRKGSSSCLQWLRKLFHLKQRKSGLVNAKVYKTYFVKWKKYSEGTECFCPKQSFKKDQILRRNSA